MTTRQAFYLLLAVAGLLLTGWHNLQHVQQYGGFDVTVFVRDVFANAASSSIGWDITVACAAFVTWMLHEARRLGMRHAWAYVAATFLVAFAVAFPLFLYMRERQLQRAAP